MRLNGILTDPEYLAAFIDVLADPDYDPTLLGLDIELTSYAPPGYSLLDDEELLARVSSSRTVQGRKLA